MISDSLAAALEVFCEGWQRDGEEAIFYEGECADGDPSWRIEQNYDVFGVRFELGWYLQYGEAEDETAVLHLMGAMMAANEALDRALVISRHGGCLA